MRVAVIKVCGDKMLRPIISSSQSKLLLQATSSKGLPMASRYFFSGSAPCPTHLLHNLERRKQVLQEEATESNTTSVMKQLSGD